MSSPSNKSRGCFQCTKRRIICDATDPVCRKCQKKGIECSGPGRFRFAGVAARGRLKGCSIPVSDGSSESAFENQQFAEGTVPKRIRWRNCNDGGRAVKRRAVKTRGSREGEIGVPSEQGYEYQFDTTSPASGVSEVQSEVSEEPADEVVPRDETVAPASIFPWIDPLGVQTRMLFSHFAGEVAPVMVVLDSISNGYRDILLPLACGDEMLQQAVAVVAAQHLALRQPHFQHLAESGRASVISKLRRDSLQSSSPERVFNISTWATLVVLLVGETVTGGSEYSHLLQTLFCLAQNVNQMAPSTATQFLTQQTHMFEFLGQPLLGEPIGMKALRLPPDHYLDWTHYHLPPDSEHHRILHVARQAFTTASQIYMGRATSTGNQNQWELLEGLKQLVSQIDPDVQGFHALVWVCFIGAADSTDPEHRRFFTERMNGVFGKTRFRNITAGLGSLPAIWNQSQQKSGRWTQNLTRLAPTLVM